MSSHDRPQTSWSREGRFYPNGYLVIVVLVFKMIWRYARLINYVVTNPNRTVAWKILDTVFLFALLALFLVAFIGSLTFGFAGLERVALFFLLVPIALIVSYRSWFSLPYARQRASQLYIAPVHEGDVAPHHPAWDPLQADDDDEPALHPPVGQ